MHQRYMKVIVIAAIAIVAISLGTALAINTFTGNDDDSGSDGSLYVSAKFSDDFEFMDKKYTFDLTRTYIIASIEVSNTDEDRMKVSPTDFKLYVSGESQLMVDCMSTFLILEKGKEGSMKIVYEVPLKTDPSTVAFKYSGEYNMDIIPGIMSDNPHYDATIKLYVSFTDRYKLGDTEIKPSDGYVFAVLTIKASNTDLDSLTVSADSYYLGGVFTLSRYSEQSLVKITRGNSGELVIYYEVPKNASAENIYVICTDYCKQYIILTDKEENPYA